MSYITKDDLKAFLDEREIAALKRDYEKDEVDKTETGIGYAMNYVKDRLAVFDVDTEYLKTGEDRSTTLMEIICHIAIWKLAATFPMVQLDGKRHAFYESALEDLKKVAKGEIVIDSLALKAVDSPIPSSVVWGVSDATENII